MTLYIESVILDNFFATLTISDVSYRALSMRRSKKRMTIASLAGTVVAVLYPLLKIHAIWLLLIKIALFISLSMILFKKKGKLMPSAFVFLALTFAFGGVLFAVGLTVFGDVERALRLPISNLPAGILAAGVWGAYLLTKRVCRRIKRTRGIARLTYRYQIEALGNAVSGLAFLDTGNRLYDKNSDMPVIVLSQAPSLKILGDKGLSSLARGTEKEISSSAHYLPFIGAGNKTSRLLIINPEAVRLYSGQTEHIIKGVVLGLMLTSLSAGAEYDALLPPHVVTELNEP